MIGALTSALGSGVNALSGALSDLINMVPLPDRVTIIPVKKYAPVPELAGPMYFTMFNPENWSFQDVVPTTPVAPASQTNAPAEKKQSGPPQKKLSFDILIDGTGASGEKHEVLADIELFKKTVGYNPSEHTSNNLIVIWGEFIFQCILKSYTLKYTLFRANGVPLRATISVEFEGDASRTQSVIEAAFESADLTHRRTIRTGDRIDNLCQKIYDTNRHYLSVAEANGLTSFRNLPVGQEMFFPPVEK
jgi:phage tail protein X